MKSLRYFLIFSLVFCAGLAVQSQNYSSLAGTWYKNGNPNELAYISQNNNALHFTLGQHRSTGYFVNNSSVYANQWVVKGQLSADMNRITWDNQYWVRATSNTAWCGTNPQVGSTGATGWLVTDYGPDLVTNSNTFRSNGQYDALFRISFSAPNRTITKILLRNSNGSQAIWDTDPSSYYWALGVRANGRTLNYSNGSVYIHTGNYSLTTLDMHVHDNGSIKNRSRDFHVVLSFSDGSQIRIPISLAGRTGGISNSSDAGTSGVLTGGSPVSSSGILVSDYGHDIVKGSNAFGSDGRYDAQFRIQFSAPYKTIRHMELRNVNGTQAIWDTNPSNYYWALGVRAYGQTLNYSNGALQYYLGNSAQTTLDLHVHDNGTIKNRRQDYKVTINFTDGSNLVIPINLRYRS